MVSKSISKCLFRFTYILFVAFSTRDDVNNMVRGTGEWVSDGMCCCCDVAANGVCTECVGAGTTSFILAR